MQKRNHVMSGDLIIIDAIISISHVRLSSYKFVHNVFFTLKKIHLNRETIKAILLEVLMIYDSGSLYIFLK
jgi:hypothetical protein